MVYGIIKILNAYIESLRPIHRRLIIVLIDSLSNIFSLTYYLYLFSDLEFFKSPYFTTRLYLFFLLISSFIYLITKQYKGISKYIDISSFYLIIFRNFFVCMILYPITKYLSLKFVDPLNLTVLFLIASSIQIGIRLIIRDFMMNTLIKNNKSVKNVVIYGGGAAGAQLVASLKLDPNRNILFIVDDSPYLWRRSIKGINIYPFEEIVQKRNKIDEIYLAIPSLKRSQKRKIVEKIKLINMKILEIPSIEEISQSMINIDNLRPISIEKLLGRDVVPPNNDLLIESAHQRNICITGAGGSIGSEITRQISKLSPKLIVLIERSEYSLYKIDMEIRKYITRDIKLIPILGCATDKNLVEDVLKRYEVEIIFHAAAYKHVPLVEANPIAGLLNNINSSLVICDLACKLNLQKVILISTDKAVRPKNIMGCSKRITELVFQSYYQLNKNVIFSIVRFGNVLDSSGSVVPLFKDQIKKGGPITLTHSKIIRYFMTISEAAQLVLQSSVLAEGGEVFLLDMGEPVLIKDLAFQMINLSGLTIKDEKNPNGDIEIITTGLRPGEKLYEELLIDAESTPTTHPLIFRAKEKFLSKEICLQKVEELKENMYAYKYENVFRNVKELVPEWEEPA